jgi:hypothetical protein
MNSHDLISRTIQISPVGASAGLSTLALNHPEQVVSDSALNLEQKREILASWASDRRAVPDMPNLRQLDSGAILEVKEVLDALRVLDNMESPLGQVHGTAGRRSGIRQPRRPVFPDWRSQRSRLDGRDDDDDDDPPPFPACAMPPNWRPSPDPATAALRIPEEPVGDDLKGRIAECLLAAA